MYPSGGWCFNGAPPKREATRVSIGAVNTRPSVGLQWGASQTGGDTRHRLGVHPPRLGASMGRLPNGRRHPATISPLLARAASLQWGASQTGGDTLIALVKASGVSTLQWGASQTGGDTSA